MKTTSIPTKRSRKSGGTSGTQLLLRSRRTRRQNWKRQADRRKRTLPIWWTWPHRVINTAPWSTTWATRCCWYLKKPASAPGSVSSSWMNTRTMKKRTPPNYRTFARRSRSSRKKKPRWQPRTRYRLPRTGYRKPCRTAITQRSKQKRRSARWRERSRWKFPKPT